VIPFIILTPFRYVISDQVISKAIALDKQHGISTRFTNALKSFDDKYKATDKARAADDKLAVSSKATYAWNSLNSYYDKAVATPTGQKLRDFYAQGNKQVMDVHNEARHLANLKANKPGDGTAGDAEGSQTTAGTEKETSEKPVPA
jgi:hypothetical protein